MILEPCTGSGERRGCASAVAREILVRIPGPRRGGGLCGSGFGAECEPPRGREDSPGSVRLRFDYRRGSAPLDHPEWSVTRGGAYDAAPTLEPVDGVPLDPFPRLDTFSLRIEPRPDFPETIAISGLVADRRLTAARAFIDEASSPCTSGTAMLSADLMRGSGELFGLCRGTEYLVNIELTDEAGNVSVYSPVPRSGGWFELPAGRVSTEPARVTLEWTMRVTGIPERYEGAGETSPSIHLFVNHLILDHETAYREGNYDYETRGHCINLPRYRVEAPAPAPAELGGALDVYLQFDVTQIDGCDRQIGTARGLRRSRVFIDQAIPTAELLSARRATIRAENDEGLSVEVVIMVTPA